MTHDPARQLSEVLQLGAALLGDGEGVVTGFDFETCNTTQPHLALPVQIGAACISPATAAPRLAAMGLSKFAAPHHAGRSWTLHGLAIFVNPGQSIDNDSSEVHGITDAHVANAPSVYDACTWLANLLAASDWVVAYNGKGFDLPLAASLGYRFQVPALTMQVDRLRAARRVVDPIALLRRTEPNTLSALHERLGLGTMTGAKHSALPDTIAAMAIGGAMLKPAPWWRPDDTRRFWTGPEDADAFDGTHLDDQRKLKLTSLGRRMIEERGRCPATEVRLDFGDNKGRSLADMRFQPDTKTGDPGGYLRWILRKDFSSVVKGAVLAALEGRDIMVR